MWSHFLSPFLIIILRLKIGFLAKRDTNVIKNLESENKALDKRLTASEKSNRDLNRDYKFLERDYDKKRDDFQDLERDYKAAKKQIDILTGKNRQLDQKHIDARVEIAGVTKRVENLQRDLEEAKRELDAAAEDQLSAVQKHAAITIQRNQLEEEKQQLIKAELTNIPLLTGH